MSTPDDLHFDPDDPRLTAYALGELPDPAERVRVEALLAASPEARAELVDLRALTAALTAEYDQERLAAEADPAPTPANVIRLPARRRPWVRPLLATAAGLLMAGLLASRWLPVTSRARVQGTLPPVRSAAVVSTAQTAAKDEKAPVPASPLLAAATLAAPAADLSRSQTLKLDAPTPAPDSPSGYAGAISVNGGTLLAGSPGSPMVQPETSEADRVTAAGSTIATSDELAAAPVVSLPSESQALSPRKVLRASSAVASKAAAGTPPPASSKRGPSSPPSPAAVAAVLAPVFSPAGGVIVPAKPLAMADDNGRLQAQVDTAKRPDKLTAMTDAPGGSVNEKESRTRSIQHDHAFNTASSDHAAETPFLTAKDNPLSTFSVDVDTASYAVVRRFIEGGSLPPPAAVHIEELLNYFPYDYSPPAPGDERPFAIHLEGAACPWNLDHRLVRVALKGRELARDKRPPSKPVTTAKDVKIQVEFDPAAVNSYRLIGYEKRLLSKEDFNDDRVDAGEIGAGRSVTALYEVVPVGQTETGSAPGVDALEHQPAPAAAARELLTVKIRHKAPDSDMSERSYEAAFVDRGTAGDYANATPDFKFAAAVATFGLALRDSPYRGNATLGEAVELAQEGKGGDASGYRAGFIELAKRAEALRRETASPAR